VNRIFRILPALVLSCAFLLSMSTASAAVAGTLATGSTGTVTATIGAVIFNNDPAALGGSTFLCPAGSAACDSDVATSTSLAFAGCSGVLGSAGCLSIAEGIDVNSPITAGSIGENNFMTFSNNGNLVFSLTGISTFTNATCAGLLVTQSCVVFPGSPLLLTLEPNNHTQVSLFVSGKVSDAGTAGLAAGSAYSGGFTQLLTGNLPDGSLPTPADIQNYFCGTNTVASPSQCDPNKSITSSQSGSFTATATTGTPEPSSLAMMLLGAGLIALAARRNRSTN
jgi:PEP-CTERM motif-containing protein